MAEQYSGDLRGATFHAANLSEARFTECMLDDVVMRGVMANGMDIDATWLCENGDDLGTLIVNGVDVAPFVDAELNRRFPGREERTAGTPEGLRSAWGKLEAAWAAAVQRAQAKPGLADERVGDEWSFTQTVRHLIMATDCWFGRGVLGEANPYHPIGQPDTGSAEEEPAGTFTDGQPGLDEVLPVRAERQARVREFIAATTPEQLAEERRNPHDPQYPETVLQCLHVIINEEWEHLRYATRDLDAIESGS